MDKVWLFSGVAAAVFCCGCYNTRVAGVPASEEQLKWQQTLKRNYPDYVAPTYAAPAESNNRLPGYSSIPSKERGIPAERQVPGTQPDPTEVTVQEIAPAPAAPEVKPAEAKAAPAPAAPEAKPAEAKAAPAPAAPEAKPAAAKAAPAPAAPKAAPQKPEPPDPTSGDVYVVQKGDTLGHLAVKHYGSVRFVNIIVKANSDIIKNPNVLKPGMRLIIPKL